MAAAPSVLGPRPLLRHSASGEGRLELRPEGLDLLRRAGAPVRVVFAIGGSRCGKSTAGNALLFGDDCAAGSRPGTPGSGGPGSPAAPTAPDAPSGATGFQTGSCFDPVTTGVDVAVRLLPGGGALIVGDCEGAFHVCGSAQSARGFGALGVLAYHVSSVLLHVSMGNIDERDLEVLGHLAATVDSPAAAAVSAPPSPTIASAAAPGPPEAAAPPPPFAASLAPPVAAPALVLLVNGARFDLSSAVARRLLRPPDAGDPASASRWCSRSAILRGFRGQPALEALPACEHNAYWPKVAALRRRILDAPPVMLANGLQASGADLADRVAAIVATINGKDLGPAAPSGLRACLSEPEGAAEALYRAKHLEPLVEEISRRFAKEGAAAASTAGGDLQAGPCSPLQLALDRALAEYDRRTAWLTTSGATGNPEEDAEDTLAGAPGPVRPELVAEVRQRLAARLAGINEAVARGRLLGAATARRPRCGRRPAALTGEDGSSKDGAEPTPPLTPSTTTPSGEGLSPAGGASSSGPRRARGASGPPAPLGPLARNYAAMEAALAEVHRDLEARHRRGADELGAVQAAFASARAQAAALARETEAAERQACGAVVEFQERWREQLRQLADDRTRTGSAQAAAANEAMAGLRLELQAVEGALPDVGQLVGHLDRIRDGLEAQRLARREAAEAAGRALECRIRRLRDEADAEVAAMAGLKEAVSRRLGEAVEGFRSLLQEEHAERDVRYKALTEVVLRMQESLEASAEEVLDDPITPPPSSRRLGAAFARAAPPPPPHPPASGQKPRGAAEEPSASTPAPECGAAAVRGALLPAVPAESWGGCEADSAPPRQRRRGSRAGSRSGSTAEEDEAEECAAGATTLGLAGSKVRSLLAEEWTSTLRANAQRWGGR